MEMIKKYGVLALCVVALIALLFPMAVIYVNGEAVESLSGLTVAFQGYICMILIAGPLAILGANYIAIIKRLKALAQAAVSLLCIVVTFIGYLQASSIASIAENPFVECTASFGFGGILCLVAYAALLAVTVLFQKDELKENIAAVKPK